MYDTMRQTLLHKMPANRSQYISSDLDL